jgi:hypothetical protein
VNYSYTQPLLPRIAYQHLSPSKVMVSSRSLAPALAKLQHVQMLSNSLWRKAVASFYVSNHFKDQQHWLFSQLVGFHAQHSFQEHIHLKSHFHSLHCSRMVLPPVFPHWLTLQSPTKHDAWLISLVVMADLV